ncbi:MAG TPA: hypothetical protein ENI02_00465 [Candidatus Aminicenantes bacterium]|nr:hypothetical protein [Candidatus Aminicenantes bacterium]
MRNFIHKTSAKIFFSLVIIFLLFCLGKEVQSSSLDRGESQEQEVKKARLYKDIFPLISESDLYCSFFVLKKKKELDLKIISAERTEESVFLREGGTFYLNKGKKDGLENGQIFLILEIGQKIKKYGYLIFMKGRAKITDARVSRATAKLDKACSPVMVGYSLVPFEEKGGLLGKDLGYDILPREAVESKGKIIYSQDEHDLIGSGDWALVDLGEEDGIQFGQQLVVYKKSKKKGAIVIMKGNLIVINVQRKTSTVKVLSCNNPLEIGDLVQTHFK